MGISTIEYRGHHFDASDSVLEVWFRLLVDELDALADKPDWLAEIRDDWYVMATAELGYGIVPGLDELLTNSSRREVMLGMARRALKRLQALGDPISAEDLNAIGAGNPEYPFPAALSAETFLAPARAFIGLLDRGPASE